MQYSQMEPSGSEQEEYEQNWKVRQHFREKKFGSWINQEGKILPALEQRKKSTRHLRLRLFVALFSTLVFLLVVGGILTNAGVASPDLTNVDLLLALVSYGGLNTIVNLLLDRTPGKIDRSKSITRRVVFASISFFLAPILCEMMIMGANGADGILLVLVSTIVTNSIFYLTLCKKRSTLLERPSRLRTARR
jgi:hypothetical protein